MKTPRTCTWAGVTATVYFLDKGEKVGRHQHPVAHTTMVLAGSTTIREGQLPDVTMRPEYGVHVLQANIDHEIEAIENGTIVLNMIEGVYNSTESGAPGPHAGVMLEDETVIPHGE